MNRRAGPGRGPRAWRRVEFNLNRVITDLSGQDPKYVNRNQEEE
jgi:hypothetical protein